MQPSKDWQNTSQNSIKYFIFHCRPVEKLNMCVHDLLPQQHFSCWALFVEACCYLLQPSISHADLNKTDMSLIEFCKAFEVLYGKENCTPNVYMHLHVKQCELNYGPVYGFWCFPFECFNRILGSFQKNCFS